jgi:hypothetical protein
MGKERNNSAGRLSGIFESAWRQGDNQKIIEAWSKVLGLDSKDQSSASFAISEALSLIRGEIDHVQSQMEILGVNSDLYASYLQRCRNALNITNLQNNWASPRAQIKEDTLLCLKYCAELTEDEAINLSNDELEDILQQVHELREKLKQSSLSKDVLTRIEKHIRIVTNSIQQYPIVGATSLRDGFRQGVSVILDDEKILKENLNTEEVKEVISVWSKIKAAGGVLIEADRITNATLSILEKAESGFKLLTGG